MDADLMTHISDVATDRIVYSESSMSIQLGRTGDDR
jgi:hypothetical protein